MISLSASRQITGATARDHNKVKLPSIDSKSGSFHALDFNAKECYDVSLQSTQAHLDIS